MLKKKIVSDQRLAIGSGQEAAAKAKGYKIELWSGELHYQCNLCPFDTFDEGTMNEHQIKMHPESTVGQSQPATETFEVDLKEDQDGKDNSR